MAASRKALPRAIRDRVMKEFNHRCAICAKVSPQIHHIGEDRGNNDPCNLIPLCPNCHLTDQHDPTAQMDPRKLSLFRQYRDPMILKPQFHPLFLRLKFLDSVADDSSVTELVFKANQLVEFLLALQMGTYYSKSIGGLLGAPGGGGAFVIGDPWSEAEHCQERAKAHKVYRERLRVNRDEIVALAVELLRYQSW